MTARPRLALSVFRIVVVLLIVLGISPSVEHESAEGSSATVSTTHDLLSMSIQEAHAEEKEILWTCTCQLYSDHRGCYGACRGKHVGHWTGKVRSNGGRVIVERVIANDVCENKTEDRGVDCQECSCGR